jgi:hypothetical protein
MPLGFQRPVVFDVGVGGVVGSNCYSEVPKFHRLLITAPGGGKVTAMGIAFADIRLDVRSPPAKQTRFVVVLDVALRRTTSLSVSICWNWLVLVGVSTQ